MKMRVLLVVILAVARVVLVVMWVVVVLVLGWNCARGSVIVIAVCTELGGPAPRTDSVMS